MRYTILFLLTVITFTAQAQSKTTEALHKQYDDALALFFYNNTLRMINQGEDKEFDDLIEDIEKMKFIMIDKKAKNFGMPEYKKLVGDYRAESFEEIMTSRYQGKNFDVYVKEQDHKTKGMIVTVNDSTNLYVLDIVGRVDPNKVTKFFTTLDSSSEIGKRISSFTKKEDKK
jgi:hypothetical protein